MNTHELKTDPKYFQAVRKRAKTFEIRKNDRGFAAGDMLVLKEYDRDLQLYTGRQEVFFVTYILHDFEGLAPGYVALAIGPTPSLAMKESANVACVPAIPISEEDERTVDEVMHRLSIGVKRRIAEDDAKKRCE